jgi:hypothetical protein
MESDIAGDETQVDETQVDETQVDETQGEVGGAPPLMQHHITME